ncbi:hypothetical protein BJ508DRAFT_336751 [Ascobolus immersus RN42]|uniref:Uncharacterized protein n=1 Tax=Ascobolus immersus RN42 TaxID=1160509 RepID=A0A3N4HF78_ASCIM|nr:hypothetical protein BJ508DRAFT_336751 [Ascobolus immersus RN42]
MNGQHNGPNNIQLGYKPKQLANLHHKHVEKDEAILEADRRNGTKFVFYMSSRRFGKEKGPTFRGIYTQTAGKVPDVVEGVRMPRSAADIEAMTDHELAVTIRAAGLCSHYPGNGTPFNRYDLCCMLFVIVGVEPSEGFLENAPANPPPSALPQLTKKQAVSQGFPAHY